MKYGSVCSGIEAASKAWEHLGWKPAWFSEIEPFPSAVLARHWPEVTNLGDMTKIADAVRAGDVEAPDFWWAARLVRHSASLACVKAYLMTAAS